MCDGRERKDIRVSVVIPVYNVGPWLAACIDSVLAQTEENIEILLLEDCSTDGSAEIIRQYEKKDPRIRTFFGTENRGQGFRRNEGINHAAGKYIYLLDSDDMIRPETLETLADAADKERLDTIFFDSEVIYDSPMLQKKHASYPAVRTGHYPDEVIKGQELFSLFIRQQEWTCYIQRQFWRREFLMENHVRFPVRNEHEDEVFSFHGILAAKRARYLPGTWFIRRYREDSVMTKPVKPENFHGYFMCYLHMLRILAELGLSLPEADRNLARIYEKMVRYYDKLHEKYDLSELFTGEKEREFLRFFEASQKAYLYYGFLKEGLKERLREVYVSGGRIHIYGAGIIAGHVFRALSMDGFVLEDFLVTGRKGNPEALSGRPVRSVSEAVPAKEDITVIAASDGYRGEIEALLDSLGARHIWYRGE